MFELSLRQRLGIDLQPKYRDFQLANGSFEKGTFFTCLGPSICFSCLPLFQAQQARSRNSACCSSDSCSLHSDAITSQGKAFCLKRNYTQRDDWGKSVLSLTGVTPSVHPNCSCHSQHELSDHVSLQWRHLMSPRCPGLHEQPVALLGHQLFHPQVDESNRIT